LVVDGFNMVDTIAESAPEYNARLVNFEWTADEPVTTGGWGVRQIGTLGI
jgi:hypothetical protein